MVTYSAGLRVSETANLKIRDIDSDSKTMKICEGKDWKQKIKKIWSKSDLLAEVIIRIIPNGEIVGISYFEKSRNRKFDKLVYSTINDASLVKPHPEGINRGFMEMGLKFDTTGIR